MFLTRSRSGYLGTSQYASGYFLMVFCNENGEKIASGRKALRVLVRKVALHQSGHFMMGAVTLRGVRFCLSGGYGHDGLPIEITEYKRRNVPPKPEEFETAAECDAYYEALAKIPFEHVERAPGLWERLHPLPDELVDRFWTSSSGHNAPGEEGPALREWALANLNTLKHLLPAPERKDP